MVELKQGDILFFGSNDFIGNAIRWGQRLQTPSKRPSAWSHVAVYYRDGLIIESTLGFEKFKNKSIFANGVQVYSFAERYKASGNKFAIVRNIPIDFQKALVLFRSDIKYPIWGLIGSLLTYTVFRGLRYNVFDKGKHKLYCSAFVASLIPQDLCFELQQDLPYPCNNYDIPNISPELLWQMLTSQLAKSIGAEVIW